MPVQAGVRNGADPPVLRESTGMGRDVGAAKGSQVRKVLTSGATKFAV